METNNFLSLPTKVRKNGYIYTQVLRNGRCAIYEQTTGQKTIAYEVFIIQIQRERNFKGEIFPRKEKFPSNEDFGYSAWSIKDRQKAISKLLELTTKKSAIKSEKAESV